VLFRQLSAVEQVAGSAGAAEGAANCTLGVRKVKGGGLQATLTTTRAIRAGEGVLVQADVADG
jgi:hypothetical protein